MKNIIIIAALVFVFSGCVTERACNRKFPPQITRDSVFIERTVTIYRDTTVYVHIKPDTVFKTDTVYTDEYGMMFSDTIRSSLKWGNAAAWVYHNRINLQHSTNDTLLEFIIQNAIRQTTTQQTTTTTTEKILPKSYLPMWARFLSIVGALSLIVLITALVIKLFF